MKIGGRHKSRRAHQPTTRLAVARSALAPHSSSERKRYHIMPARVPSTSLAASRAFAKRLAVASGQSDVASALEKAITEDIRTSAISLRVRPHMANQHEGHAATSGGCPPSLVPLRFQGNERGFGNRLGWLLTAAAVAEALNVPALLTYWPGGRRKINGDSTELTVHRMYRTHLLLPIRHTHNPSAFDTARPGCVSVRLARDRAPDALPAPASLR